MQRLARRMQVRELSDLTGYSTFLLDSPEEVQALFRDLLITVTNFFRDPEHFEFLKEKVIPKLFRDKRANDQVRVWSAGCATGEEAYSLGMMLAEYGAGFSEAPIRHVF